MKLSLLIDSSKIKIDDFYKEIISMLKDINYELIFLDNGDNEEELKSLYEEDLVHVRLIFYSGNIDEICDKSIKYCSGDYICLYDDNYDLDLLMKSIKYLDENTDCDYYEYQYNLERSFIDKIKRNYPSSSFLIARKGISSFKCLVGCKGFKDELDLVLPKKDRNKQEGYMGKMVGFDDENLL